MAVINIPMRNGVSLKLNGGKDPTTQQAITRSISLNGIKAGADGDKILNVVETLAPVLSLPVTRVEVTQVNSLERDG